MHKFLAVCFIFISFSSLGQAKRALSLMDKLKYDAAFELLETALSKDTTTASVPFVLANLFLVETWPHSNIDSAYYFSLLSLTNYDLLTDKKLDKHIKDGFGKTKLMLLKIKIDSLAFIVAKQEGTESSYQQFIDKHKNANELDSAAVLRNEQAFIIAENKNTLESYKLFLTNHPKAIEWQRADSIYQSKLYYENTVDGKLKEYISFAATYPKSPYYEKCVKEIYSINVGRNNVEAILDFVDSYPKSKVSQLAIGLLYHYHIEQESATTFADKYPRLNISDSLKNVIHLQDETFIPIWKNNFLQLIDTHQNVKIDSISSLDLITIDRDFISIGKNSNQQLIGKNGNVFYSGQWTITRPENRGYVFLDSKEGIEVVHKNGSHFNAGENARLIGPFISYKKAGLWGLKSITNKLLLKASYDSIWEENELIFIKQKEKISINKPEIFYSALDKETIHLAHFFTDFEWLTDRLLWVEEDEKEGLFSNDLEVLVPLEKQRIDLAQTGWSIVKKKLLFVPEFSDSRLISYKENSKWQLGEIGDSLLIRYNYQQSFAPDKADLLGPSAIVMTWADSSFVYLSDSIRFYKPKECIVKPLLNQSNEAYYYEVVENKQRAIINSSGDKIKLPKFKKIIALNQHFFQLENDKNKFLYNAQGGLLLDDIDGVSMVDDSTLSVLKNQQFGLIIPKDSIYIEPSFDQKLIHLFDSIWVFSSQQLLGLISLNKIIILPAEYDEFSYWTNGLIFIKKDLKWRIYDLNTSRFIETGIVIFETITKYNNPTIRYQKGVGIGVFDSEKGLVLKPTFTAVYLEGNKNQPYYRAEKYVEEAGLHIMIYYDLDGKLMFQNIMSEEEYEVLFGALE